VNPASFTPHFAPPLVFLQRDQSVRKAWHTKCHNKTPIRMPNAERPHWPLQATAKPRLLDQVRGVLREE